MSYATADDGSGGAWLESMARTALAAYDLPGTPTLRPLAFGLNATFEVRAASTRYVLRVHRGGYRTADQIRSELEFVRTIGAQLAGDPKVPEPVPDRDGALVVETEYGGERRYCDLLSWLDGRAHSLGSGADDAGVWALGRALGRLHNASTTFRPPAGFTLPRWDFDGMFDPAASPFRPTLAIDDVLAPADRAQFADIASRTKAAFDALGSGADAYGVTHIDYILGNCFLHRGTKGWDVSVFDFDDCGWGYFVYDLCPLLGNLAGYPGPIRDNPAYPDLRDAYFAGYRSVRPLPPEWERLVPLMLAARNANHCLLTARPDVSKSPAADAAWRMDLARRCLDLPV
jgi:Ser/Thr protein kinase RdoA (MazF antagonist)